MLVPPTYIWSAALFFIVKQPEDPYTDDQRKRVFLSALLSVFDRTMQNTCSDFSLGGAMHFSFRSAVVHSAGVLPGAEKHLKKN